MKYILRLLSVIVFSAWVVSCGHSKKENSDQPAQQTTQTYKLVTLEPHQISGAIQLPGLLEPFEFVQMYPKVNGFVKNVFVDRGSVVKQGQVLITLEAPEIEQHVSAAKLQYTQAHANYLISKDKYERLLETSHTPGTVSQFDLSAAQSKMQADSATAQGEYANYKAQEVMQGYLTVTSPFDGVITERDIHPGALVGPGEANNKPMLILQQLSKLRLVVDIPEQYTSQLADADGVHYRINALPGQDFTGKIARSAQSLNNYRSETIEIDVFNPKDVFKPGMYAEVTLPITGSANAFVVPKSAIVTTTERKYVVQIIDNQAKWVDVTEGNENGDSTEIFGNLHTSDQIVANANYQIKEGQTIAAK
ncbi:MAG TPA: efflux RND transporter periplasmic adaptor subunit [Flavipsychrobacter sp.]|nr:efflux RND transporter periplasmic adaptor subunit [Flavipsychrobacter sp.]